MHYEKYAGGHVPIDIMFVFKLFIFSDDFKSLSNLTFTLGPTIPIWSINFMLSLTFSISSRKCSNNFSAVRSMVYHDSSAVCNFNALVFFRPILYITIILFINLLSSRFIKFKCENNII